MKKRREGLSLLTICSWLKDLNISPLGFLRLQDLGLKCASLPHNKTSWEIKTSGLYYVFITLWNSSHLNSFCTDYPSGWCKSRLEGNLEMSLTLPASSTVLWIQVRFLKSSSLLFSEQEAQIQLWRVGQLVILVCCCFGVTLSDLIKEIAFWQLSGRTRPGARGRRVCENTIFGVQGSLARPCPSRTPIASAKYLENIWCCWHQQMFI